MKILVTGGGGFLGSAICKQLVAAGHEPIAFQRSEANHLDALGVHTILGDIRDPDSVHSAVSQCESVIHCAAYAGLWGNEKAFHAINVKGTINVLNACRSAGVGQMVHTSSPSVVLKGEDIEGGDESLPLVEQPLMPYQASKIAAEALVKNANSVELKTVILRPHLMWGPGDPHFLPRLIERAKRNRLFLPAPDSKSDVVFVENGARAHVQAVLELNDRGLCAGKAYFVTNNDPQIQRTFVTRLLNAVGVDANIRTVPPAFAKFAAGTLENIWRLFRIESEPPMTRFMAAQLCSSHWFDSSAARRDFGYVAPISIEQGLEILASQKS